MKYIKTFEDLNTEPKIGDYVLMNSTMNNINLNKFLADNIGKILNIDYNNDYTSIEVEYEDIPSDIQYLFGFNTNNLQIGKGFRDFLLSSIIDKSENKEDLKYKIDAKKFNI